MKEFTVYHAKDFSLNTLLHFEIEGYVADKDDYKKVAEVVSDGIGDVFRITNHIDYEWWKNPEVLSYEESRSTSVGDVVEDEDGQLWLCAGCGWEKIEWGTEENDSIRSRFRFWKNVHDKFNDINAETRMNKAREDMF